MFPALATLLLVAGLHSPASSGTAAPDASQEMSSSATAGPGWLDRAALWGGYATLYAGSLRVGSRFGLERRFEAQRLESAYVYDLVAHVWVTRELGELLGTLHERAGAPPQRARRMGAWLGAFGALGSMELINGFMPGVRLDPYDPLANALGAWIASEGAQFAERHSWTQRLSFQFGYRDIRRTFGAPRLDGDASGNLWHDYPNGRLALGWDLGARERPFATALLMHEMTSFELERLRNRLGLGLELRPIPWLRAPLRRIPGGSVLGEFLGWLDERFLIPGMVVELLWWETGPFSDREPFAE